MPGPAALVLADQAPPAPYAAVEVELDAAGEAVAGLATAHDEHVVVRWTPRTSRVTLEVRREGRTRVLRRRTLRGAPPVALAFALCESQTTAGAARPTRRGDPC